MQSVLKVQESEFYAVRYFAQSRTSSLWKGFASVRRRDTNESVPSLKLFAHATSKEEVMSSLRTQISDNPEFAKPPLDWMNPDRLTRSRVITDHLTMRESADFSSSELRSKLLPTLGSLDQSQLEHLFTYTDTEHRWMATDPEYFDRYLSCVDLYSYLDSPSSSVTSRYDLLVRKVQQYLPEND